MDKITIRYQIKDFTPNDAFIQASKIFQIAVDKHCKLIENEINFTNVPVKIGKIFFNKFNDYRKNVTINEDIACVDKYIIPMDIKWVNFICSNNIGYSVVDILFEETKLNEIEYYCRKILKSKITLNILVESNDINYIKTVYNKLSYMGVNIKVLGLINYNSSLYPIFENWVYDKNGTGLSIFSDIVSHILLNTWNNICHFSSCLSKNVMLSSDKSISFCTKTLSDFTFLKDNSTFETIFSNDKFINILKQSIQHRNICMEECNYYSLCQGGCPLKIHTKDNCSYKEFFKFYEYVRQKINDIKYTQDYKLLNPFLRHIILSSVAYGNIDEDYL